MRQKVEGVRSDKRQGGLVSIYHLLDSGTEQVLDNLVSIDACQP